MTTVPTVPTSDAYSWNATGTASPQPSWPTGIAAGDFVYVVCEQRGVGPASSITPASGFDSVGTRGDNTSVGNEAFLFGPCSGSESGSMSGWSFGGGNRNIMHVILIRGVDPAYTAAGAITATGNTTTGSTSVVAPAVVTTQDNSLLIRSHGARIEAATAVGYVKHASESAELEDNNSGATTVSISMMSATETAATAGSQPTRAATASTSINDCVSRTTAFPPIPDGGGDGNGHPALRQQSNGGGPFGGGGTFGM